MDFLTPKASSSGGLEARRSRFLAMLSPAQTAEQAASAVEEARAAHPGARHTAWAFVVGGRERCSDDGEPQGTAGQPILTVLKGAGLGCAVLTVTRYFGGTLLGTGGLIRAYGGAARLALANAALVRMSRCARFVVECGYKSFGPVASLCSRLGGGTEPPAFGQTVRVAAFVPEANAGAFCRGVAEITLGACSPVPAGTIFRPAPSES